jgi:hypothetical protein
MGRLAKINRKYEEILHSQMSDEQKNLALAKLMTQMEREFEIPALENDDYEKKNKAVMALYRKISMSRNI